MKNMLNPSSASCGSEKSSTSATSANRANTAVPPQKARRVLGIVPPAHCSTPTSTSDMCHIIVWILTNQYSMSTTCGCSSTVAPPKAPYVPKKQQT